jgi:thiosulfate/3-mercaptopyruvate sulfurtransferase
VFVDLDRDLSAPPRRGGPPENRGGRHPLPDPAAFQAAMRRAGVRGDRPVVAYDQGEPGGAARAWWLLGWFGHPDARVLDGGLPAWVAAGLPLATGDPAPEPGGFTARPGGRWLLDAAGAADLAATGLLLDARAPARYQGREEPVDPVAGHIPGARNAPLPDLLQGRALQRRLADLGVGEGVPVGAYCGSGVVAAHLVLALEAAGIPAALYAGSWSDWITDPSRPVVTGPDP